MDSGIYLFVYGTLLADQNNTFSQYLTDNSQLIGSGFCHGELYLIDWYPGLVSSGQEDNRVVGQVIELTEEATEIWQTIDDYEGISSPAHPDDEYVRTTIQVSLDGRMLTSWTYLYQQATKGLQRIESGDFNNFQKLNTK